MRKRGLPGGRLIVGELKVDGGMAWKTEYEYVAGHWCGLKAPALKGDMLGEFCGLRRALWCGLLEPVVERSDTTGFDGMKSSHPEGVTECGQKTRTVLTGIPSWDAWLLWGMFRGFRCAQSPPNGFDPSGIQGLRPLRDPAARCSMRAGGG